MKATIDAAGRLVVPKPLRERLGFEPGTQLDLQDVDGHLEVTVPSRVWVEERSYGRVLATDDPDAVMTSEDVRALIEEGRR